MVNNVEEVSYPNIHVQVFTNMYFTLWLLLVLLSIFLMFDLTSVVFVYIQSIPITC